MPHGPGWSMCHVRPSPARWGRRLVRLLMVDGVGRTDARPSAAIDAFDTIDQFRIVRQSTTRALPHSHFSHRDATLLVEHLCRCAQRSKCAEFLFM